MVSTLAVDLLASARASSPGNNVGFLFRGDARAQSEAEVVLFSLAWHRGSSSSPQQTAHATVQIFRLHSCSEAEAVENRPSSPPTVLGSGSRPGVMAALRLSGGSGELLLQECQLWRGSKLSAPSLVADKC